MNGSNKLRLLLNIQPGEGRLVSLLLLQYFCLGVAFNFTQTTAFTLFLTEFNAQTLAWVYIANAIIIGLLSAGYLRLGQRLTFRALLSINLGFLLFVTIAFQLGLGATNARWLIFALPILFQILINLGNLSFWPLAARLMNVRQSKRLFGVVGAGQWIAIVITGFLIPSIVTLIGAANLLIPAAGGLIGALAVMLYITRTFARPAEEAAALAKSETGQETKNPLANLLRSRDVLLRFALVVVWWLAFFLLDNLFYDRSTAQYPNADQLASFLGVYLGGLGILTLLINFCIAGPVISRFGLRVSLLLLPIGLLVTSALVAGAGTFGGPLSLIFGMTVIAKLLDMSVGLSIDLSARTILYQPLPTEVRSQVQTIADGIVQPFAIGLTGVMLLALYAFFTSGTRPLMYALLIVVAVWVVVAYRLGREYPQMLIRALSQRRLSSVAVAIADASSVTILKQQLQSPHAGAVIYALNMLAEIEPKALTEALPGLLDHPAEEVRRDALDRMAHLGLTSALPAIRQHLSTEPSPDIRGAAVKTLAALGGMEVLPEVLGHLADPASPIKSGAIVGLLRSGRVEGMLAASGQLFELIDSPHSADRILAAHILGEIGAYSYYQPLLKLLSDPDPQVKRAALHAAGQIKYPSLWPVVIDNLSSPQVRGAAAAALVAGGRSILLELQAAWAKPDLDRAVFIRLVQVCGRIHSEAFIDLLKAQIDHPDARMRGEVLRALSRCGYRASPAEVNHIQQRVMTEAEYAAWLLAASIDIGDDAATALLQAAFTTRWTLGRERLLHLLSFLYDPSVVSRARHDLQHASAEKRAYALEVVDTLIPQTLKPVVLPMLDDLTPAQRLKRSSSSFPHMHLSRAERLRAIICDADDLLDPWLQACALYSIGQISFTHSLEKMTERQEVSDVIASARSSTDPLVRETANWVGLVLAAHPGVNTMLSTLERVIILKTVSIFAETSDEVLAEVAAISEEVELPAGRTIFEKGELGDSLYIIVSGKVRVYDRERLFNYLGERDVFGEMAVLDPEPRSASVAAVEETHLLRLDQQALFELMDDHPEVARGIIHVLSRHLRNRMKDLTDLDIRLQEARLS